MTPDYSIFLSQWQDVQLYFGLKQAALGRLLGLSPTMMSHVAAGRRPLPATALPTWTRLVLALTPPTPPPAALTCDAVKLALYGQDCLATAARLATELADAQARAACAERRLAALPQLAAPLRATDTAPPGWLEQFESEARVALAEYGPTAQALLAAQRASQLRAAEVVNKILSDAKIFYFADEVNNTNFSQTFNHLPTVTPMAFSVSRFTTKAQCQAYLDKKAPERTLLVAHLGTVQAELAT